MIMISSSSSSGLILPTKRPGFPMNALPFPPDLCHSPPPMDIWYSEIPLYTTQPSFTSSPFWPSSTWHSSLSYFVGYLPIWSHHYSCHYHLINIQVLYRAAVNIELIISTYFGTPFSTTGQYIFLKTFSPTFIPFFLLLLHYFFYCFFPRCIMVCDNWCNCQWRETSNSWMTEQVSSYQKDQFWQW